MVKRALLIGVSNYQSQRLGVLEYVLRDLERMRQVLQDQERSGFEVTHLPNLSHTDMQKRIAHFFRQGNVDDLALLYFSGHGKLDSRGRLFLTASDTDSGTDSLLEASAVRAEFLKNNLQVSKARQRVVILDCCYSGAIGDLSKSDLTLTLQEQLGLGETSEKKEGWALLTSCTSFQQSYPHPDSAISIYTHFLAEGIEGAAASGSDREQITIQDLHDYAKEQVKSFPNSYMDPEIYCGDDGSKIVVASVPEGKAFLSYSSRLERYKTQVMVCIEENSKLETWKDYLDEVRKQLKIQDKHAEKIEREARKPIEEQQERLRIYLERYTFHLSNENPLKDSLTVLTNLKNLWKLNNNIIQQGKNLHEMENEIREKIERYQNSYIYHIERDYPSLSEENRIILKELQERLYLSDECISNIQKRIFTALVIYRRDLNYYKNIFYLEYKRHYPQPLNEESENYLSHEIKAFQLEQKDVDQVEAEVRREFEMATDSSPFPEPEPILTPLPPVPNSDSPPPPDPPNHLWFQQLFDSSSLPFQIICVFLLGLVVSPLLVTLLRHLTDSSPPEKAPSPSESPNSEIDTIAKKFSEEWCLKQQELPNSTQRTVEALLDFAGTKNCQGVGVILAKSPKIEISKAQISDLKPFSSLIHLRELLVKGDPNLQDLTPLSSLSNLERLEINYPEMDQEGINSDRIKDLTPLKSLKNLKTLVIKGGNINDLEPLSALYSLENIDLSNNRITSIKYLQDLRKLETLKLSKNRLENIDYVKEFEYIKVLDLSNNNPSLSLRDISSLQDLTSIQELYLSRADISDVSQIDKLKTLKRLDLSFNPIGEGYQRDSNLNSISSLKNLLSLNLHECKISDISSLNKLQELEYLKLSNNYSQFNLKPLEGLRKLKVLVLFNNSIQDISPLASLEVLEELNLQNNWIQDISQLPRQNNWKEIVLTGNNIPVNSRICPKPNICRF